MNGGLTPAALLQRAQADRITEYARGVVTRSPLTVDEQAKVDAAVADVERLLQELPSTDVTADSRVRDQALVRTLIRRLHTPVRIVPLRLIA